MTTPVRGFGCPCGGEVRVTSVRKPSRGLVVRYRRCLACGSRVVTEERVSRTRSAAHAAERPTGRTGPGMPASGDI